mmetsp:Transcript_60737/g.130471  ORF Transcript_60737/g.130471 Transcript_60737/m.130471 type:complete len:544 (-) Transcript_60737:251-1882(-)
MFRDAARAEANSSQMPGASAHRERLLPYKVGLHRTHAKGPDLRALQLTHHPGHLLEELSDLCVQLIEARAIESAHAECVRIQPRELVHGLDRFGHLQVHLRDHIDPGAAWELAPQSFAELHLLLNQQDPMGQRVGVENKYRSRRQVLQATHGELIQKVMVRVRPRRFPEPGGVNDLPMHKQRRARDEVPEMSDCQLLRGEEEVAHLRAACREGPHKGGLPHIGRTDENDGGLIEVDAGGPEDRLLGLNKLLEDRLVVDDIVPHLLNRGVRNESGQAPTLGLGASAAPGTCGLVEAMSQSLQAAQELAEGGPAGLHVAGQGNLHTETLEGVQLSDEPRILEDTPQLRAEEILDPVHSHRPILTESRPSIFHVRVDFDRRLPCNLLAALVHQIDGCLQHLDLLDLSERAQDRLIGVIIKRILPELAPYTIVDPTLLRVTEPAESLLHLDEPLGRLRGGIDIGVRLADHPLIRTANVVLRSIPINAEDLVEVGTFWYLRRDLHPLSPGRAAASSSACCSSIAPGELHLATAAATVPGKAPTATSAA